MHFYHSTRSKSSPLTFCGIILPIRMWCWKILLNARIAKNNYSGICSAATRRWYGGAEDWESKTIGLQSKKTKLFSSSTHNILFWRWVFPGNDLNWYWQQNSKQTRENTPKNTKRNYQPNITKKHCWMLSYKIWSCRCCIHVASMQAVRYNATIDKENVWSTGVGLWCTHFTFRNS